MDMKAWTRLQDFNPVGWTAIAPLKRDDMVLDLVGDLANGLVRFNRQKRGKTATLNEMAGLTEPSDLFRVQTVRPGCSTVNAARDDRSFKGLSPIPSCSRLASAPHER